MKKSYNESVDERIKETEEGLAQFMRWSKSGFPQDEPNSHPQNDAEKEPIFNEVEGLKSGCNYSFEGNIRIKGDIPEHTKVDVKDGNVEVEGNLGESATLLLSGKPKPAASNTVRYYDSRSNTAVFMSNCAIATGPNSVATVNINGDTVNVVNSSFIIKIKGDVLKEGSIVAKCADIEVNDVYGEILTSQGNITANDVHGKVTTHCGNIDVRHVSSGTILTSRGDITANDVHGKVTTHCGNIDVKHVISGAIKTHCGNISYKSADEDSAIETMRGQIQKTKKFGHRG